MRRSRRSGPLYLTVLSRNDSVHFWAGSSPAQPGRCFSHLRSRGSNTPIGDPSNGRAKILPLPGGEGRGEGELFPNCIVPYRFSAVIHNLPRSPFSNSAEQLVNNCAARGGVVQWTGAERFGLGFLVRPRKRMNRSTRLTSLSQILARGPNHDLATHPQVPTLDVLHYTTCDPGPTTVTL